MNNYMINVQKVFMENEFYAEINIYFSIHFTVKPTLLRF